MQLISIKGLVVACGLFIASITPALAQSALILRYATFLPANHIGVLQGSQVLMENVEKSLEGRVEFQFFPAEQAGKALQLFDIVRAGAIDIVEVASAYISSGNTPLVGVIEIPGLADTACQATAGFRSLGEPGGLIYRVEFAPNGVLPIAFFVYPPYQPSASIKPINSVEDLNGMKIRSAGGLMERSVGQLGAVPVKLPSPEMYDALHRRTIDAVLLSYLSAEVYDLASVADYAATGYSLGTPSTVLFVNERKFRLLPADIRQALLSAGRDTEQSWCHYVDANEDKTRDQLIAGGMQIHKWTAAERARLDAALAGVPADWARSLDARGKPGTRVLEAFKAAVGHRSGSERPVSESARDRAVHSGK